MTTAPAKAKTYAGHPVYDACAVMNPFLMQQAGFVLGPGSVFLQHKFIGDEGGVTRGAAASARTTPTPATRPNRTD